METYKCKFKFYCPKCDNEEIREFDIDVNSLNGHPQDFILNMRDMMHRPLYHYPCSKCQSLTNATISEYWIGEANITKTEQDKDLEAYIKGTIYDYGNGFFDEYFEERLKEIWERKQKDKNNA